MLIPFILFKILVRADIVGRNGIDGIETIYSLTFCHATLPGPYVVTTGIFAEAHEVGTPLCLIEHLTSTLIKHKVKRKLTVRNRCCQLIRIGTFAQVVQITKSPVFVAP